MKLACYLNEIDDDPIKACAQCSKLGIKYVCIGRVWSDNIINIGETALVEILSAIKRYQLEVAIVCTDIGHVKIPVDEERRIIRRAMLIAFYFNAPVVRMFNHSKYDAMTWADVASKELSKIGVTTAFEIDTTSSISPVVLNQLIDVLRLDYHNCKFVYNPVSLIKLYENVVSFWNGISSRTIAMVLSDFKRGVGYVPLGHGDCRWNELDLSKYDKWLVLEPNLGKYYGQANTKLGTVELALQAVRNIPQFSAL